MLVRPSKTSFGGPQTRTTVQHATSPRKPRFPICRVCLQTTFAALHAMLIYWHIVMLSASYEFDWHIVMRLLLLSSCDLTDASSCNNHLVIWQKHHHASIIMLSSSCEFVWHIINRHIVMLSWSCDFYASQTKIFDGWTKRSMSLFDALFESTSTRFGLLVSEKCFEKTHRTVRSAIENLRLGSIILTDTS